MSKAQHPSFYSLNDENGLPSNEIYQCLQDMNGFIWIGCDAGLFRYDGFEFKKYTCGRQNGRSISGLQTDVSGRMWCRNFAGQVYRVDADSLRLIADLSTARNNNSQYALDDKGNAWIVKDQELLQYDGTGKLLFARNLLPDTNTLFIFLDIAFYQNRLFISGAGQVPLIFDVSDRSLLQAGNNLLMDKKRAWSFYQLQNRLFILLQHPAIAECSIYEWKDNDFILQNSFIKTKANNRIFNLKADRQNHFWLCTSNGLIPYNFNLKTLDDTTPLFKANNISNLLHDKEGTYWITTLQNGIKIIPSMDVIRYDALHSGLNESNITAVAAGGSKVAMGTFSGRINLLDKQNQYIQSVTEIPRAISIKRLRFFQDDLYVSHGMISVLKQGKFVRKSSDINIRDFSFAGDSLIYISPEVHGKLKVSDFTGFNTRFTGGGRAVAYCKKRAIAYYALNSGLVLEKNGKIIPVEGRLKNPL